MKTFVALLCLVGIASASVLPARKQLQHGHALIPQARADQGFYGRIIGGSPANEGQFPFMVNLELHHEILNYICGGTIYAEDRVLTAGHCCDGTIAVDIYAGSTRRADSSNGQNIYTTDIYKHEDYDSSTISNDVCVLKTPTNFDTSNPNIGTISLASSAMPSNPATGTTVTAVGWGIRSDGGSVSNDLYYVEGLEVISDASSSSHYPGIPMEDKFCIDTNGGQQGVCSGDSGGPVIDTNGVQVGVNSFVSSLGCESAFNPTHCMSDVGFFSSWISGIN